MATWKKWTSTVLVNGQPEPNVEVHVYEPGTTNEITVYEDEGVTPITQPILTDSQGRYAFFVDVASHPEIRIYLEKDGVDFSEANEDLDGVPVPGAGGTFIALTDTPSSYSGKGGHVVLVKTTEDGIETQPWPVTGSTLNFFLSDDAADVGSYYYMYPTESGDGYSELTSPSLSAGDDQLLWSFVTEAGEPGIDQLALGAYTATLFLKKTGKKDVRVYWKLFKRDTGGTETEILQSAESNQLTTDNSQYLISAYLNEDQSLDSTDRLVFKLYANVSGTGTDVTVTLTMEGDYDSRLAIHVLSSAFSLDRLSDVTITSPADNELLAYDSGSGKWINQTPSEAGVLAADGSVPLSGDLEANGHSINNLLTWPSAGAFYNVLARSDVQGDGTNDDTEGIQAAIDAVYAMGGGIVFFPAGTYKVTSTLNLKSGVTLCGAGREVAIIKRTTSAASGGARVIQNASYGGEYDENMVIRDLTIQGYYDPAGSAQHHCIGFWNVRNVRVVNCKLQDASGDGILARNAENAVFEYNEIYHCGRNGISPTSGSFTIRRNHISEITGDTGPGSGIDAEPNNVSEKLIIRIEDNIITGTIGGNGIVLADLHTDTDGTTMISGTISGNKIESGYRGIYLKSSNSIQAQAITIEGNEIDGANHACVIEGMNGVSIHRNYLKAGSGSYFGLSFTSHDLSITGNVIVGAGYYSLLADGAKRARIIGNIVLSNPAILKNTINCIVQNNVFKPEGLQVWGAAAEGNIIAHNDFSATTTPISYALDADSDKQIEFNNRGLSSLRFDDNVPASGTWAQGDIVFNRGATAGGKVGWVCVEGGSPGTWKPFGVIDT